LLKSLMLPYNCIGFLVPISRLLSDPFREITLTDILDNIRSQPANLARVADYQLGAGHPALTSAADKLRRAQQVVFTGMGSSLFAGVPAARALCRRGIPAQVVNTAELLHGDYPAFGKAAVVLVSRSGESVEVMRVLPLLKAQGTTLIGITNVPDSPLARESDYVVLMHSDADQMVSIQTYTATVLVLRLLSAAVTGELGAEFCRRLDSSIAAMSAAMPAWIAESPAWPDFLEDAPVVYLLGRGDSQAAMMQGALMFNEVAKTPSVAMEMGLFRHGPVEVVNERFRAIVFTPTDAMHDLNMGAVQDLSNLGGQVRHIGPDATDLCWRMPVAEFASLMEIVPVQLVACHLARRRGITPGQLLITSLVTRDEVGFAAKKS
jgi:glucosamine--fructose-6-phosphate aminotransferase (isomerizing)